MTRSEDIYETRRANPACTFQVYPIVFVVDCAGELPTGPVPGLDSIHAPSGILFQTLDARRRAAGRVKNSRDRLHLTRLPRLTEVIAVNVEVNSLQDGYFGDIDRDRGDGEGKRVLRFSCGLGDRALR